MEKLEVMEWTESDQILRDKAVETEHAAKEEKIDFDKKVSLFLEAARIREKVGTTKDKVFDYANYHSARAKVHRAKGEFSAAKNNYKAAAKMFVRIDMRREAFFDASAAIFMILKEKKAESEVKELPDEEYLVEAENFLKMYEDFHGHKYYIYCHSCPLKVEC